ncbi:uncharacterized protein DUF2550 [Halopolyspora algeriensis]|uniref:Uncharacterized protein DUF2550 n=1 Tax=Halopolyspora algeriensis TaxID=1500506 RepID=A0A368VTA5_9ACTN|nr:DUF2550 domain-containing protein [Halopolyspora algeriensis]RCW45242.1 uncharacterized protein DUF2550 [Halopolyspora algeriensis]TQM53039.1 uncharacterized protein DUF2550 [Halopolyspora algeriensis]
MGAPVVWYAVIATLLIAALLLGLGTLLLAWRRLRQLRTGGIDVALRAYREEPGRGWHLGVARYRGEEFAWYRALSVRSGPNRVFNRGDMEIVTRREPAMAEAYTMPVGAVVLHLSRPGDDIEVAMGPDALTGFLSWLESAPPGSSAPWAC